MVRLSFNQARTFVDCNRRWYYSKVLQLPDTGEKIYADAGTVVHNVLEAYYKEGKKHTLEQIRAMFLEQWAKHKLGKSLSEDKYWEMTMCGIKAKFPEDGEWKDKDLQLTSCEFEVFYPDFLTRIDGVNSFYEDPKHPRKQGLILDWKTSKRKSDKDRDYTDQLLAYAWSYHRKFNVLPAACVVYYLQGNTQLIIHPTLEDIQIVEKKYDLINGIIEDKLKVKEDITQFQRVSNTQSHKDCYWCPYKEQCAVADNTNTYTILLQGDRLIVEEKLAEPVHVMIEKYLNYQLKNAHFVQKAVMAKTGRHWDAIIRNWSRASQRAPIGFMHRIMWVLRQWSAHKKQQCKFIIRDAREQLLVNQKVGSWPMSLQDIQLYDHQVAAVTKAVQYKMGVIEVPTGGGKTAIAAELMRQVGGKALFVINNKDLLWQTAKEYEKLLAIKVGIVGAGVEKEDHDWSKQVTLATVQTLIKHHVEYAKELVKINVLIGDECHGWAADSYKKLSKLLLNTQYRIGLSGTVMRDDGHERMIEAYFGSILYSIQAEDLEAKGIIMKPKCVFIQAQKITDYNEYAEDYKVNVVDNVFRNDLIADLCITLKRKKVLVLCRYVAHCDAVKGLLQKCELNADLIYGATEDDIRKDVLTAFRQGKIDILVGNISMFSKGIDVRDLDVIINAAGAAGEVSTIQSLGRVLRVSPGKEQALYIDFMDQSVFGKEHSLNRIEALKKRGRTVEIFSLQEFIDEQSLNRQVID